MSFMLPVAIGVMIALHATPATASDPQSHEGVVVSASQGKLTMKDEAGREHSHDIDPQVKITVNGKPGKLEDLKAGMRIRVITDEKQTVLSVTTLDGEKQFATVDEKFRPAAATDVV